MRKLIVLLVISSLSFSNIYSQYSEAGMLLGGINYMGDISPNGLAPTEYNLSFGFFGRYYIGKYVAFKGSLLQGNITGTDANNTKKSGLNERNLSFRTSILELSITNEIHLAPYEIRADLRSVPYFFTGISAFYFNPQAEFKGNWYDLQPLGTEGQESLALQTRKYNRIGIAIPFGFGIKWAVTNKFNLGFEVGARKTITDYLDDVSGDYPDVDRLSEVDPLSGALSFRTPEFYGAQMASPTGAPRGNPNDQDWYFIGGLTISINLTGKHGLEWDPKYKIFGEDE